MARAGVDGCGGYGSRRAGLTPEVAMTRRSDWREMPVWKCMEERNCGEQWAPWDGEASCPFVVSGAAKLTGFTCGEVLMLPGGSA